MWAATEWQEQGVNFPEPWYDMMEQPTDDPEEAMYDASKRNAQEAFFEDGWIRVKKDMGVEAASLDNLPLIRKIISQMARTSPVDTLYADIAGQTVAVPISGSGRPNFRELNALAKTRNAGTNRSVRAWLLRRRAHGPALDRAARGNIR
jgi:hypothetical protein